MPIRLLKSINYEMLCHYDNLAHNFNFVIIIIILAYQNIVFLFMWGKWARNGLASSYTKLGLAYVCL